MIPVNLSFGACGFLGIYHLGVISAIQTHGRKLLLTMKCFAGASAGALAATLLATAPEKLEDCKQFTYKFAKEVRSLKLGAVTPGYDFIRNLRDGIEDVLPADAHKTAESCLHISITHAKTGKNYMISEFSSRDDLIKVLLASCFVPFYAGISAVEYRGEKWMDGGLSNSLPIFSFGRTVTVTPFSGPYDICPDDTGLMTTCVKLANQNVLLSMNNVRRLNQALFPPVKQKMELLYQMGYDNAVKYLRAENLFL
ncbi:patatin-like phospholipase domain-containing protein 4 isoform X1 [Erpetoichthys calabaricus]|uniref:Patatin-like phospholipase domain containing 4 n=1 Tax=Erpetoichthys calabaricus TaxID=27687 RepID=A0A8C4SJN5_ERPCA|nr:patatin-like phospholipase domain-containing protein 4 isoform X1 [Erpetoichthys calabaricus]